MRAVAIPNRSVNSFFRARRSCIRLACVLSLCLFTCTVSAEGNCPNGYYPIGGGNSGWQGCAPMSTGDAGNPPDPGPQWATRWGAIAVDGDKGSFGGVEGQRSKGAAKKDQPLASAARTAASDARSWRPTTTNAAQWRGAIVKSRLILGRTANKRSTPLFRCAARNPRIARRFMRDAVIPSASGNTKS